MVLFTFLHARRNVVGSLDRVSVGKDGGAVSVVGAHAPGGLRAWTGGEILVATTLLVAAGTGAAVWRPYPLTPLASQVVSLVTGGAALVAAAYSHRLGRRGLVAALVFTVAFFVGWYLAFRPLYAPLSDNAEALEIGVRRLLAGRDPWAVETRFAHHPSPMLGGYLLAAPFVLLTGSVYGAQLGWMALLLGALWRWASPHAALVVGLLFTASAHTRLGVPNESDNWIVAVAVLLSAWWGWRVLHGGGMLAWWASSAVFGVALSYRFILWVAVVPLAVFLVRDVGRARALRWMGVAGGVTVALSFGPLLWVPRTYLTGPVAMAADKVADQLPGARWVVAVLTVTALLWASSRVRSWADVWAATALALAVMVGAVVLTRLPAGIPAAVASYETVAYNGTFLVLGLVSLALRRGRTDACTAPTRLSSCSPARCGAERSVDRD